MTRVWVILTILAVQALSAFFFISDILSSYIGVSTQPLSWEMRETLEISAAAGLAIGVVFGAYMLWDTNRHRHRAEQRLRVASGAFSDLLTERFAQWALTPAEADVAFFAIKGMSTAEIAALRNTSEGTVKAQTNAIYRKAGVTGRSQLLSLFIDDLMGDDSLVRSRLAATETPPALPETSKPQASP